MAITAPEEDFLTAEQKKALQQLIEQLAEPCADNRAHLLKDIIAADRCLASAAADEVRRPSLEKIQSMTISFVDRWLEDLKELGAENDENIQDDEDEQAPAAEAARATAVIYNVSEEAARDNAARNQLAATNAANNRRRAERDKDFKLWNTCKMWCSGASSPPLRRCGGSPTPTLKRMPGRGHGDTSR